VAACFVVLGVAFMSSGVVRETPSHRIDGGRATSLPSARDAARTVTSPADASIELPHVGLSQARDPGRREQPDAPEIPRALTTTILRNYAASTVAAEILPRHWSSRRAPGTRVGVDPQHRRPVSSTEGGCQDGSAGEDAGDPLIDYDPERPDIDRIRRALAPDQPRHVRLEAIYLLEAISIGEVTRYVNDEDEALRLEAARIVETHAHTD
jgi:hypothetical protein